MATATNPSDPLYLTPRETARLLSISRNTLRRHVNDGLLPAPVRLGGCVRFKRCAVLAAFQGAAV